tara:strand:- start:620 stop:1162 length:543 start_codon:yes stop_codon:yes gene_type:complete
LKEIPLKTGEMAHQLQLNVSTVPRRRQTALELLNSSLQCDPDENFDSPDDIWPVKLTKDKRKSTYLRTLEISVYNAFESPEKYADQILDLCEALKKKKFYVVPPAILAVETSEQLFDWNPPQELTKDEIDVINAEQNAESLIKCTRCGGRATWKQRQTRSADEPMTQFCKCTRCGKEWRQ